MCVSHSVIPDSAAPWTVAHQAPLSLGFSRQEYWRGLPFPSPGDLPDPATEPGVSCIAGRFFTIWASREAPCKPFKSIYALELCFSNYVNRNHLKILLNCRLISRSGGGTWDSAFPTSSQLTLLIFELHFEVQSFRAPTGKVNAESHRTAAAADTVLHLQSFINTYVLLSSLSILLLCQFCQHNADSPVLPAFMWMSKYSVRLSVKTSV